MLLRFSVTNCRSIATTEEISLVASNLKGPECSLVAIPGTDLSALPSAIIYGANASGKTNFLKAFSFFRGAILQSHARGNPEGGVPRIPFKLDPDIEGQVTSVEAEFVVDGVRMQYGFECDDKAFTAEWLFTYPEGKRRRLFERTGSKVDFGSHFKGSKKILVDLMRPNSLFISTATQNDHVELSGVVSYFRRIKSSMNVAVAKELINNTFKKGQVDPRTIEFLKSIGTGIDGFRQTEIEVPENVRMLAKEFMSVARKHMGDNAVAEDDDSERLRDVSIEFSHVGTSGESCFFGLERESSGTRRLVILMNIVFKALDDGSLVLIDELDASLHTFAAAQILELFENPNINRNGAQLIATTHDTNLLSLSKLRRDQIWFCEKDNAGASHLFPLSDIKSRPTDNFEQGYLEGRYGAIPYSGNLIDLFESR
jgi:AAA15 family ATPase/GTPase